MAASVIWMTWDACTFARDENTLRPKSRTEN